MSANEACRDCRFSKTEDGTLICRRYPPKLLSVRGHFGFPGVGSQDWCGEWLSMRPGAGRDFTESDAAPGACQRRHAEHIQAPSGGEAMSIPHDADQEAAWAYLTPHPMTNGPVVLDGPKMRAAVATLRDRATAAEAELKAVDLAFEGLEETDRARRIGHWIGTAADAETRAVAAEAKRDKLRSALAAAVILVGEHARARGEAEGKMRAAGWPGVVDGWRDKALAAEAALRDRDAEVERLRAPQGDGAAEMRAAAASLCDEEARLCLADIVVGDETGARLAHARASALLTASDDIRALPLTPCPAPPEHASEKEGQTNGR